MNADLIARRYAEAFIKCLDDAKKDGSQYLEPLKAVASVFQVDDARRILNSPVVPQQVKKSFFEGIFQAQKADSLFRNFIYTVLEKNRVAVLPFVAVEFQRLMDIRAGITRVEVFTPISLTAAEEQGIQHGLKHHFNTNIEITQTIDPAVLGGMVIKVGNRVLDMSIRAKIEGLFQAIVV